MSTLIFLTSAHGGLIPTDGSCAFAGGLLVIDTSETLPSSYTLRSQSCRFAGGSIVLNGYDLTLPRATYADPYDYIFNQTSAGGQVYFSEQTTVSPCWWGADPSGNGNLVVENLTYNAFQWAEIAIDANWGSVVYVPPGHYILDAGQTVLFRNSHHIGKPGTVRLDFDPLTVPSSPSPIIALFGGGNPNTRSASGQKNGSWNAVTNGGAGAANCNFLGALDPTTCLNGNVWYGIDIVHDITDQGFLGENRFLIGLYIFGGFNQYIANSNFIGLPNDGLNIWGGSGTLFNVECSLNGTYGGLSYSNETTRNGATFAGWMDVLTPDLTTDSIRVINCRFKANAGTGLSPGGCSNDTLVDGCTTIGNGNIAYEFILYKGEDITQYQNSITVAVNDLLYVPAPSTPLPPNLGGSVWQCQTAGTTSATGNGPNSPYNTTDTDGSAKFLNIGYMPPNGRIAASYSIANCTDEGAIPATVNVPWLGAISVPLLQFQPPGGNSSCVTHVAFNAGNEKRISIKNTLARSFGNTVSTSPVSSIVSNNGGEVEIDGYELDNCYVNASSVAAITMYLGYCPYWPNSGLTPYQGTAANNRSRVRVRNVRFRNPTFGGNDNWALRIYGNLTSYDIDGVTSDALLTGTNGGFLRIEHAYSAASVLDYGRIANCECAGTNYYTLLLSWENGSGSSVTNGIDIENNRLFNSGSTGTFGTPGPATLVIQGSSSEVTVPAAIRLIGNKFSYGGVVAYPVGTNDISTGLMSLSAYNNRLNEGAYFLTGFGGLGMSPTFINPLVGSSAFYAIQQDNNGLPGDRLVLSGTSGSNSIPPGSGTWQYGDRNKRITPLVSGSPPTYVSYDECIIPGTLSGQMSGCTVTVPSRSQIGTYSLTPLTGAPPLPGEWIEVSGTVLQVVYANNGNIGVQPSAPASGVSGTASYSGSAASMFQNVGLM